jgi:hypothetical protein
MMENAAKEGSQWAPLAKSTNFNYGMTSWTTPGLPNRRGVVPYALLSRGRILFERG